MTRAIIRAVRALSLAERLTPFRCSLAVLFALLAGSSAVRAQWLNYPTPGIPRLANGAPNLKAPAPRTPDGKPDFSGM